MEPSKNGLPDPMTWKHEIVQVVKGFTTKAPTTSFLPAFEYVLPIERLMRGQKFAHHGVITVQGSFTQFFFAATATPPRPIIDDIDFSYVPELGTYPPASAARDIQVKLEPAVRDGVPVKAKFQIRLSDTTKYPGCAMNAHNGLAPCPVTALENDPDVRFEDAASLPPNCTKSTVGTEQLLTCSDYKTTLSFKVVVEDFGAYTKLRAEALDIEVGSKPFPKISNPVRGLVQTRPPEEHDTTLPIDRGVGGAVSNNKIADVGWQDILFTATDIGAANEDSDDLAAVNVGTPGDGLTRIEEYRGFFTAFIHTRTDPNKRDVFFTYLNNFDYPATFLGGYEKDMRRVINVHLVDRRTEVDLCGASPLDHCVNFTLVGQASPPVSPQNAVYIIKERCERDATTGQCNPLKLGTTKPGPGNTNAVEASYVLMFGITSECPSAAGPTVDELVKSVAGHEGGHSVAMTHKTAGVTLMSEPPVVPSYCSSPPTSYGPNDFSQVALH
ncbi:MAG: hypothetical protein HYZ28_01025 [Myxococcales bacterium]|nr:hypothetical protein [Myxococcales bacterium]